MQDARELTQAEENALDAFIDRISQGIEMLRRM
jgi:hypothetical protein